MASFALSATTGGAHKHAWAKIRVGFCVSQIRLNCPLGSYPKGIKLKYFLRGQIQPLRADPQGSNATPER